MLRTVLFIGAYCVSIQIYSIPEYSPIHALNASWRHAKEETKSNLLSNTHWNNVQFHSGVFGQGLEDNDIRERCMDQAAIEFDDLNPSNVNNYNCSGPLAANTTCCYCFFARDYEQLVFSKQRKYWSCAVARNNSLAPLNETRITTNGANVAWITGRFGHGDTFKLEVEQFCQYIREKNVFDPQDTYCYWDSPDYVLQNPMFRRHLKYRTDRDDVSAKGGGFWFHKSVIMRHLLDTYKDGDYLIYTDSDRVDFFDLGTYHPVLETMMQQGNDLCVEVAGDAHETRFNKEDVLAAFNASDYLRGSPQVLANAIVVRNSPIMKRFMDAWIDCMADWHMVSDEPSILPNGPMYEDHRHDQSIFSLLVKSMFAVQTFVGPPARGYQHKGNMITYNFQDGVEPKCPFASFNALLLSTTANRTVAADY